MKQFIAQLPQQFCLEFTPWPHHAQLREEQPWQAYARPSPTPLLRSGIRADLRGDARSDVRDGLTYLGDRLHESSGETLTNPSEEPSHAVGLRTLHRLPPDIHHALEALRQGLPCLNETVAHIPDALFRAKLPLMCNVILVEGKEVHQRSGLCSCEPYAVRQIASPRPGQVHHGALAEDASSCLEKVCVVLASQASDEIRQ
mmetsp:Transcript_23356/g.58092  ORF Transcript_23356/g.58092 Transcript_23356/m.58092 type:complete len:201 (-) Transcript_23356:5028-5630(-)